MAHLVEFCGELRGVWETLPERAGALLRKLLSRTKLLQSLPQGVVRVMLSDPNWASVSHPNAQG
jgi:hypothetical protein